MTRDHSSHDYGGEKPRDAAGKWIKTVDSAERDAEAARLWSRGSTFQQIADELQYSDRQNARRGVIDALKAVKAENADEIRKAQLGLIAELKQAALAVLEEDHYVVSYGQIMKDADGEPLIDPAVKLAAIDRLEKLIARESTLTGTPAPVKSKVDIGNTGEERAELQQLIAEARARLAEGGTAQGDAPTT